MKNLNKLLLSEKSLSRFQDILNHQEKLFAELIPILPQSVLDHLLRVLAKDGEWLLLVDSPAWASRLRYQSTQLVGQLRKKGIKLKRIRVKVALPITHPVSKRSTRRAMPLSTKNADLLRLAADSIEDDDLSRALIRLSRHAGLH